MIGTSVAILTFQAIWGKKLSARLLDDLQSKITQFNQMDNKCGVNWMLQIKKQFSTNGNTTAIRAYTTYNIDLMFYNN